MYRGTGEDMKMVPADSVHAVVISKVLCCVNDAKKFLEEVKRVLKPVSHFGLHILFLLYLSSNVLNFNLLSGWQVVFH